MATVKNFEISLRKLEEAVEQLESGEMSLDQALKVFSAGVKQAEQCRATLRDAELKIEQLMTVEEEHLPQNATDDF